MIENPFYFILGGDHMILVGQDKILFRLAGIRDFTEVATKSALQKRCWSLFAGLQVCNLLIRGTNTYVFLQILRNFKEHRFEEHLGTTASSYFMNKKGNNSSQKNLN